MLKWFLRKYEDARVYKCIKEVKWELGTAEPAKRATILAMAQLVHEAMIEAGIDYVLNDPFNHSREILIELYQVLEDIRDATWAQLDTAQVNIRMELPVFAIQRHRMELPLFAIEHARMNTRGVEVWMCTVGAGISPHLRDDVRLIWTYLAGSSGHVELAIRNLRDVEQRMCELTGAAGAFLPIPDEEWKDLCGYVPAAFRVDSGLPIVGA